MGNIDIRLSILQSEILNIADEYDNNYYITLEELETRNYLFFNKTKYLFTELNEILNNNPNRYAIKIVIKMLLDEFNKGDWK